MQSGQQQTERRAPPSKGRASRQGTDVSRQTCTHTKQNKMMQCAHVRAFQQTTFFALDSSFSLMPRPTTLGGACFFLCIYMLEYKQLHVYHNVGNCHIILDTLVLQALFNPYTLATVCVGVKERMCMRVYVQCVCGKSKCAGTQSAVCACVQLSKLLLPCHSFSPTPSAYRTRPTTLGWAYALCTLNAIVCVYEDFPPGKQTITTEQA